MCVLDTAQDFGVTVEDKTHKILPTRGLSVTVAAGWRVGGSLQKLHH